MPIKWIRIKGLAVFTVIQAKNADFFVFSVIEQAARLAENCGILFLTMMSIVRKGERSSAKRGEKKRVGIKEMLDILGGRG